MNQQKRAHFVLDTFDPAIKPLITRPRNDSHDEGYLSLTPVNGIDELQIFCTALRVGFSIWPECWKVLVGLCEYLAYDMVPGEVLNIDGETCQ